MKCPLDGTEIDVHQRFILPSTSGPMEHLKGLCKQGHHYCGPVAYVAEEKS